ncbi:hypothetical protein RJT34_31550 [Clitoria ternatea]|uniref:Uncharacterized protein n=1 Tax=Clitoria ternatea TaxID=43366 RepID=A0AAN9I529_CLITE
MSIFPSLQQAAAHACRQRCSTSTRIPCLTTLLRSSSKNREREFLCGITPSEEFDTKNSARSKFVHYEPEVVAPLWHENLKILFVTNGTSKIHYFTEELDGSVLGMENTPVTPFTCDMSASGDFIVAALM